MITVLGPEFPNEGINTNGRHQPIIWPVFPEKLHKNNLCPSVETILCDKVKSGADPGPVVGGGANLSKRGANLIYFIFF